MSEAEILEEFLGELSRLQETAKREAHFTIARYAPVAALRLAELVGSEKGDIARRAALDLVDRCLEITIADNKAEQEEEMSDDQVRSKLLRLAEGMGEARV